MMDIIASLSLLGYCLSVRRYIRCPIEMTPFFVVSIIIVFFYIFISVGILETASTIIFACGLLLFLCAPIYLWQDRQNLFCDYFTPGFVIFIIYFIVFGALTQDVIILGWDELSRWAPHARFVLLHHTLWHNNDNFLINQKEFPPANALLYYFFTKWGAYSDQRFQFAHLFFVMPPLLILLCKYRWSNWLNAFLFYTVILIFFDTAFTLQLPPVGNIMLDRPAGLFFGGILMSYFILHQDKRLVWFYVSLPAMALVLFKPMLYPFIVLSGMIMLCDQAILLRQKEKSGSFLGVFTCVISAGLVYASWQYYLKHIDIRPAWTIGHILNAIRHPGPFDVTVMQSVMPLYQNILTIAILFAVMMCIWAICIYFRAADSLTRYRIAVSQGLLLAGYVAYLALLSLIYLYLMPKEVQKIMASFNNRFMIIYYIGWFLVTLVQTIYMLVRPLRLWKIPAGFNYMLLCALIIFEGADISKYWHHQHVKLFSEKINVYYIHHTMQQLAVMIRQKIEPNATLDLLWIGRRDLTHSLLDYALFPHFMLESVVDQDFGTFEQFEVQAKSFDYLLLGHVNSQFWQRYGRYFPDTHHPIPLTIITLCTDPHFYFINEAGCTLHQSPIFLYKVVIKDGRMHLINMATK